MPIKTVNISIPDSLLKAADKQAEIEHRTRSDFFRESIRSYLFEQGYFSSSKKFSSTESERLMDTGREFQDIKERYLTLSCVYRPQPNQVIDIFSAGQSSVIELIENPPKFRNMGWDLHTLDRARPVNGQFLEVKNGTRKTLRVYRDGQTVFVGDETFIGHGVNRDMSEDSSIFSINGLAIAELITNFVVFSKKLSGHLSDKCEEAILRVQFHNPGLKKVFLQLVSRQIPFPERGGEFYLESADQIISVDLLAQPAEKIAYSLLAEFFYFFGMRNDQFQYVNKEQKIVDLKFFYEK